MTGPLISVIIPVYNVELYLAQCLQSVCDQSYTNLEIIIVDDGSTDSSPSICEAFALRDQRIKVIHQANQGQSAARNAGLEIMTGEFFGFVDSDDYIAKEMYAKLYHCFSDDSIAIAACQAYRDTEGEISLYLSRDWMISEYRVIEGISFFNKLLERNLNTVIWDKLYRTEYFGKLRFVAGKICEDFAYTFELSRLFEQNKWKMVELSKCYYYYRKVATSTWNSNKYFIFEEWFILSGLLKDRYYNTEFHKDKIYQDLSRMGQSLVFALAKSDEVFDLRIQKFCKSLSQVPFSITKDWGKRHRLYFYVMKRFPYYSGNKIIRKIASKNGYWPIY